MSWEWLLGLAPFLLLLACPLVMWSMMKGMGGMSGGAGSHADRGGESGGGDAGLHREVEVLRARIAEIEEAKPVSTSGPAGR